MTIRSRKSFRSGSNPSYSQLENRNLLSADLSVELIEAAEISSSKPERAYAEVQWRGESLLARNDQWIIWQDNDAEARSQNQHTLQVGDQNPLGRYVWAADQELQVTKEISPGLFVLSGTPGFSYELVAKTVAAWMPDAVVEPDFILTTSSIPNDTDFSTQWALNNTGQSGGVVDADIDAVEAWEFTTGSSDVVVGVIDSGIDYTHPDLVDNIWTNPGEIAGDGIDNDGNGYIDDIHGWDFANNDNDPMDTDGHGTHVAGTIGAVGNNNRGVAGVSQNVSLIPLKFLDGGSGASSDAIQAIEYANAMRSSGVNILMTNNSWGGGDSSFALQSAIRNALNLDILFVAAAGNDGEQSTAVPSCL